MTLALLAKPALFGAWGNSDVRKKKKVPVSQVVESVSQVVSPQKIATDSYDQGFRLCYGHNWYSFVNVRTGHGIMSSGPEEGLPKVAELGKDPLVAAELAQLTKAEQGDAAAMTERAFACFHQRLNDD